MRQHQGFPRIIRSDRHLLIVAFELANPDVAIPDGVTVVLEQDRALGTMRRVLADRPIGHCTDQRGVVVDEHAVMQHRDVGGRLE